MSKKLYCMCLSLKTSRSFSNKQLYNMIISNSHIRGKGCNLSNHYKLSLFVILSQTIHTCSAFSEAWGMLYLWEKKGVKCLIIQLLCARICARNFTQWHFLQKVKEGDKEEEEEQKEKTSCQCQMFFFRETVLIWFPIFPNVMQSYDFLKTNRMTRWNKVQIWAALWAGENTCKFTTSLHPLIPFFLPSLP